MLSVPMCPLQVQLELRVVHLLRFVSAHAAALSDCFQYLVVHIFFIYRVENDFLLLHRFSQLKSCHHSHKTQTEAQCGIKREGGKLPFAQ